MNTCVIAYDIGTTGIKTCVFEITNKLSLVASETEGYPLYVTDHGFAEQKPQDWWKAMCSTTQKILEKVSPESIKGISFCAQMQGLVLVDEQGDAVRNAISYMDNRGNEELREGLGGGLCVAGINAFKLLKSLRITGAVAASVKDPVWKYKWVQKHEPQNYAKVHKWLDVKDYLIGRCTGEFTMTEDSAFATMLYDVRKGKQCFSHEICSLLGVDQKHLPRIIKSTDKAGRLTEKAAMELKLPNGIPVFGGGGDASLIGVGAGSVKLNSTHIYLGTSGWVSTVVSNRTIDLKHMIASIVGANPGFYNYFAELETAGKCLEWVRDHLALDEIGIYMEHNPEHSTEGVSRSMYDYMMEAIKMVPAGSQGVIFTPWLHGNRCPFEDPNARGMFFNISLDTGKTELIHAVLEGICYHIRWQLEAQQKRVKTSDTIRLVGGGALAPLTCQLLADILDCEIETVENPQNSGAVGAAVIAAIGLGIIDDLNEVEKLVSRKERYIPNKSSKQVYDKYFRVFQSLYKNNRKNFKILNEH